MGVFFLREKEKKKVPFHIYNKNLHDNTDRAPKASLYHYRIKKTKKQKNTEQNVIKQSLNMWLHK